MLDSERFPSGYRSPQSEALTVAVETIRSQRGTIKREIGKRARIHRSSANGSVLVPSWPGSVYSEGIMFLYSDIPAPVRKKAFFISLAAAQFRPGSTQLGAASTAGTCRLAAARKRRSGQRSGGQTRLHKCLRVQSPVQNRSAASVHGSGANSTPRSATIDLLPAGPRLTYPPLMGTV